MTIEVKLNVVVNKLAGQYQNKLSSYRPITHIYPSSPAVSETNGMTIKSNIRHHLIKVYTESIYIQCLQDRYKWTDKTVQLIVWKCFNLGLKRIDKEVLLVKICNNLLLKATTLQKWG